MSDKEILNSIQNDIKNIDKCIKMCNDEDDINYLKSIQENLRELEIEIVKKISMNKLIKKFFKQHE